MRVIILAAGQGQRLRPYTSDRPKCLVQLGGRPLLIHQIEALRACGLERVTVVTGYCGDQIAALGLPTIPNPDYARSNMTSSLMCAARLLDGREEVLVAYGDTVYEPGVIDALRSCPEQLCITVDRSWRRLWQLRMDDPLSDAETLKLNGDGTVAEVGKKPATYGDIEGQYMGLTKIRADFAPVLVSLFQALDRECRDRMDMTTFLQHLIDRGHPVHAVPVDGGWLEIDQTSDLELYRHMDGEGTLGSLYHGAGSVRV